MGYKTINGLMKHLRVNGIAIANSTQKRQLINTGYFHGYKGYRFYKDKAKRLPFSTYKEINATIQYDSDIKSLLYSKMMFIETAVKNIALECILDSARSESIQVMCDKVISGYHNAPIQCTTKNKEKLQQNKLNLQNLIQKNLAKAYSSRNQKIMHFYNNVKYSDVPIWALFEILTMGDFGYLLSCLTYTVRDAITKRIGFNLASDTNRELLYKFIYTLKDLRNAIAHNGVVFDTRFNNINITPAMESCLKNDVGLPYLNLKTIGDYIILISYYLKFLHVSKTEVKAFIHEFEKITAKYKKSVNPSIYTMVVHPDLQKRMTILKQFI